MEKIIKYSQEKINNINNESKRYLYEKAVNINEKIIWIVWFRWVGKTTLLLQIASLNQEKSAYFSMDSVFIRWKKIFDIIEEFYKNYDKRIFFIDEIHKYKDWQQDLKTLYDFYDDIKIYFSGSSSIDLIKWNYDLSRRWILLKLEKLSFREFLYFTYKLDFDKISLDNIMQDYKKISLSIYSKEKNILTYFEEYLSYWELAFTITTEKEYYKEKLSNTLNKSIYEDISSFYKLKTENIYYFFEILRFIANSRPSDVNYLNISRLLSTTPDTIKSYIQILKEIWLLHIIWKEWKISVNLRKSKKIFFELNNLIDLFSDEINIRNTIWLKRESFVVRELDKITKLYYPEKWDLIIVNWKEKYIFEIWWKNKKLEQIKWIKNWFLVKDGIDIWTENQIPIYLFWFLY